MPDRTLRWEGVVNGRDLGGLPLPGGDQLGPGRLCRSASLRTLTPTGWSQLREHGVRTVIDLRTPIEVAAHDPTTDSIPGRGTDPASGVIRSNVPLEPDDYARSWADRGDQWKLSTPLYYEEFLVEHRQRVADALRAVADADDGGVLVHCSAGRDRAGLVVAFVLDLIGVDHEAIVADHWRSFDQPAPIEIQLGIRPPGWTPPRSIDRDEHHRALHRVLRRHPASSCLPDRARADALAERLRQRLTPGDEAG